MGKYRIGLILFCIAIIISHLALIDYDNVQWENNSGNYIGAVSMGCVIISLILSNRYKKK